MDFLEKLEKNKYGKVKRRLLRKFIDEYRIKDKKYLYETLVKMLDEWGNIYYDRELYIDYDCTLTHELLAALIAHGKVDFEDTYDPVEHPGIVFRYVKDLRNL